MATNKELFEQLTQEQRRCVLNDFTVWNFAQKIDRELQKFKANISYRSGVIAEIPTEFFEANQHGKFGI